MGWAGFDSKGTNETNTCFGNGVAESQGGKPHNADVSNGYRCVSVGERETLCQRAKNEREILVDFWLLMGLFTVPF
jgi:hypothetical protein